MTEQRTPTLDEVIARGALAMLASRPSVFLARVESYDIETQRVDVKPVHRIYYGTPGQGEYRDWTEVLVSLPVVFPSFGDWVIHGELVQGDHVVCLVSHRSLEEWLKSGDMDIEAADLRIQDPADGVALPGVWPDDKALPNTVARAGEMVLSKRDGSVQIRLKDDEVIIEGASIKLGANATEPLAIADKIDKFIKLIDVLLLTWTVVPGDGAAALKAAWIAARDPVFGVPAAPIGSVATTKVKGE